jgi:hypothetical protein
MSATDHFYLVPKGGFVTCFHKAEVMNLQ